jgi:hypothetical protein
VNDNGLAALLTRTWKQQAREGFLLSDPDSADIEERAVLDQLIGISYRLRWMPHREIRSDTNELERRGILNPDRDESLLFRDPRDASGRHCFLCVANIVECHPLERLIPLELAGRRYYAGSNFAWIERNHYTVMAAEHIDQDFAPHVLEAMVELHRRTGGEYRVLYNGAQAGATIPWHLHYQITTERLPVEGLPSGYEDRYPAALQRIEIDGEGTRRALEAVHDWLGRDPEHHRVNVLVAGPVDRPMVYVFARDRRLTHARAKGLMGGFEICGDLVYSEPDKREIFQHATAEVARRAIAEVRPRPV